MELHPLAQFYNTPANYELLKRFVGEPNIQIDIDERQLAREVKKVEDRIDKALQKAFR